MNRIKQSLQKAIQSIRKDEQLRAAVITIAGIGLRLLLKR